MATVYYYGIRYHVDQPPWQQFITMAYGTMWSCGPGLYGTMWTWLIQYHVDLASTWSTPRYVGISVYGTGLAQAGWLNACHCGVHMCMGCCALICVICVIYWYVWYVLYTDIIRNYRYVICVIYWYVICVICVIYGITDMCDMCDILICVTCVTCVIYWYEWLLCTDLASPKGKGMPLWDLSRVWPGFQMSTSTFQYCAHFNIVSHPAPPSSPRSSMPARPSPSPT